MMYATQVVREEKDREVCHRLDDGFCPLRLPEHLDVPLWLVVRGLGAQPMILMTKVSFRRSQPGATDPSQLALGFG